MDYKNSNKAYDSNINIRVHKEFKALLKAEVNKYNITMSDFIRRAIDNYLNGSE